MQELQSNIYLTTQSVIAFVEKEFDVLYTQSGMRDFLHRIGYEYKKPKLIPGNPDVEAQEIFAMQYEDLKVLYNTYHKDISAFRESCIKFFRNINDYYDELEKLMQGEFDLS